MPRTWQELVVTSSGARASEARAASESAEPEGGFFRRLRDNMSKTRRALGAELRAGAFQTLDDDAWERLEETLLLADVGVPTTARIVERLELEAGSGNLAAGDAFTDRLRGLIGEAAGASEVRLELSAKPAVIMVVGVNGTGKTTTIGKLAWHLRHELGLSVLLGAADTYRAAAVEQLTEWADRADAEIVRAEQGSDPGAVVFDALEAAVARERDVVIIDTAGRLHNQKHLMDELAKVGKVIEGRVPGAPHETLLTIDATTGQNGLSQARLFGQAMEVSGVVLTKLDGTAKGGIALAIAGELGVPVKLIGIGESVEDLRPFDPDDFAAAILD